MATSPQSAPPSTPEGDTVEIRVIRSMEELPPFVDEDSLVEFLHRSLIPYEDAPKDIRRGIRHAITDAGNGPGFVLLALSGKTLLGALVMLDTGMTGYIPENLLLFVAVDPDQRGSGIGQALCERGLKEARGEVKLHVEYDNPAKRLYERLGFESKYADMRYSD
jgi:GNAT superfamily N-acetyltransferase